MTDLTGLVRSELTTVADSGTTPADLADRAVTAGVRRRRWRRVAAAGTAVAAVVAVTVAATQFLAPPARRSPDPQPAAVEARNVVFAKFRSASGVEILDPATGVYRTVAVGVVMEPSADLRYAPVVPPGADGNRIGRYDTTTGEIGWFDPPQRWAAPPTISPDGRYLAAPVFDTAADAWAVMVVDADTAETRMLPLDPETVAAKDVLPGTISYRGTSSVPTVQPHFSLDIPLVWQPDSRHVFVGNAVVDLTGRRTATVPVAGGWLIAPRPGGEGMLVVPKDALDAYVVTDASGREVHRRRVDWACTGQNPAACSQLIFGGFLGWRGPGHILVKSPEDPAHGIDAIDVGTGQRARVGTHDAVRVIVVPADNLAPGVRDTLSF